MRISLAGYLCTGFSRRVARLPDLFDLEAFKTTNHRIRSVGGTATLDKRLAVTSEWFSFPRPKERLLASAGYSRQGSSRQSLGGLRHFKI